MMTAMVLLSEWMESQVELWVPIQGLFVDVSNFGRLRSWRTRNGRLSSQYRIIDGVSEKGYRVVKISSNEKRRQFAIHRLVLIAFRGVNPKRPFVNHITGYRPDCRLDNLEWCTNQENATHRKKSLGYRVGIGERSGGAKLTEANVLRMRELLSQGLSQTGIGRMFGVSQPTVRRAAQRPYQSWKHLRDVD